jgi:hypothetical protein
MLGAWNIYGPPPGATLSPEIQWMLPATNRVVHFCKVWGPTVFNTVTVLMYVGEI